MSPFHTVLLCTLVQTSWGIDRSFPPYFKFGAATSAYQVEGGWNADGKGENMWDRYVHEHPENIRDNATGDVAADSYHLWREDVKAAIQMGLQTYRFSINWPRILPTGFTNEVNKAGVKYYSDLIDALLAAGIEPVVTLYHWELPVKIRDLGGWTNPLIVDWFGDYARVIYSLYADRVKTWLTINEPISFCDFFYNSGNFAPGIKDTVFAPYLCNKHILLAHAKAYRIFDEEFRPRYKGRISLANHLVWIEPATPSDTALAELGREHLAGRYSHPIFSKKGGWPTSIEKLMLNVSLRQGYKTSRLPAFSEEEKAFVKGTADFYAMNYYTTYTIRPARRAEQPGYWFITGSPELNAVLEHPPGAKYGSAPIMPIVPEGIRKQMAWLKKQYGDIDILITENGYSSTGSQLHDYDRVNYIKEHLKQILLSINVDKVRVVGYTAWSLIDNFEWMDGYMTKFGLYEIDFERPNRTRTPRVSAHYYGCVIARRSPHVPDSCYKNKLHDSDSCYNKKLNDLDSCYTTDRPVSRYRRMQQRNSGLRKNGGTPDFFGLNYYTTYIIRPAKPEDNVGFCFLSGSPELNAIMEKPRDAYYGATTLLPVVPKDLRQIMAWLQRHYGDIDIIDGFTSSENQLDDHDRMDFFKEHLEQVLLSMKVDNVSVTGYAAWSLMTKQDKMRSVRSRTSESYQNSSSFVALLRVRHRRQNTN